MTFVYPEIGMLFDTDIPKINSLIIENPIFFCKLLNDIVSQINGMPGDAVLSENNKVLDFSKCAEVLEGFVPFDINRKPLLSKIATALEKCALNPEHYEKTMQTMRTVEDYLSDVSFDFPCDIIFPKLGISSLIKSGLPELRDNYDSLAEKILDYMEMVTVFDRKKLFFTINLRSYLTNDQVELFAQTAISHGYSILMIESFAKKSFPTENRCVIDSDLCEFSCNLDDSIV